MGTLVVARRASHRPDPTERCEFSSRIVKPTLEFIIGPAGHSASQITMLHAIYE